MVRMNGLSLKQKPIKLLIIVALALIITVPMVLPHQAAAQTGGYYDKSFAWDYNGKHWTWNLSIPVDLYNAYKSVPVSTRTQNGPAGYDMMTTTQEPFIQNLAAKLNDTATQLKYNSYDTENFVLAFVQSIPYSLDFNTTGYEEYPRFPIETLVDQTGDCDCKAILYATLTLTLGYDAVFINPTDHLAVGVLGNNIQGTYWTYPEGSNKTYYYAETTGVGFTIGQLPDEFQGKTAYIYNIGQSKQYVPNIVVTLPTEPSLTNTQGTTTLPTPTLTPSGPNTTTSSTPLIPEPSVQQVLPLSFNLISGNPLLFIIIAFAILVSVALAVWSVRKPKQPPVKANPPVPIIQQAETTAFEGNKFCIYCGSNNKAYAAFCEKCGKQIG
jgi:hypothetical protein